MGEPDKAKGGASEPAAPSAPLGPVLSPAQPATVQASNHSFASYGIQQELATDPKWHPPMKAPEASAVPAPVYEGTFKKAMKKLIQGGLDNLLSDDSLDDFCANIYDQLGERMDKEVAKDRSFFADSDAAAETLSTAFKDILAQNTDAFSSTLKALGKDTKHPAGTLLVAALAKYGTKLDDIELKKILKIKGGFHVGIGAHVDAKGDLDANQLEASAGVTQGMWSADIGAAQRGDTETYDPTAKVKVGNDANLINASVSAAKNAQGVDSEANVTIGQDVNRASVEVGGAQRAGEQSAHVGLRLGHKDQRFQTTGTIEGNTLSFTAMGDFKLPDRGRFLGDLHHEDQITSFDAVLVLGDNKHDVPLHYDPSRRLFQLKLPVTKSLDVAVDLSRGKAFQDPNETERSLDQISLALEAKFRGERGTLGGWQRYTEGSSFEVGAEAKSNAGLVAKTTSSFDISEAKIRSWSLTFGIDDDHKLRTLLLNFHRSYAGEMSPVELTSVMEVAIESLILRADNSTSLGPQKPGEASAMLGVPIWKAQGIYATGGVDMTYAEGAKPTFSPMLGLQAGTVHIGMHYDEAAKKWVVGIRKTIGAGGKLGGKDE